MGLHHPRGRPENRRQSISCWTDHKNILPPGLRLDHNLSLDTGELDVMAPVLMLALLSGLAGNLVGLEKPGASPLLTSFEIKGSMKGFGSGLLMSGAPGTPLGVDLDLPVSNSMDDMVKCETFSREMSQQDSPIPDVTLGDISEIIIDDDDDLDKTIEELQPPVAEPTPSKKRSWDEVASSSSPPKKCAMQEEETTAPPLEDDLPTGVRPEDILPKWYPWVHKVRCSLLGLAVGNMPSREDIDSSERFVP